MTAQGCYDCRMNDRLVTSEGNETGQSVLAIVSSSRRDWGRALKAAALVFVVGPPAGSLVVSAAAAASGIADAVTRSTIIENLPQAISGWISLSLFLAAFSYVYGVLPIVLSCLWLGWRIYQRGTVSMAESIWTSVAAAVVSAGVISVLAQDFPKGLGGWLLILLVPAIFSAFVCRRLLGALGILPPALPESATS